MRIWKIALACLTLFAAAPAMAATSYPPQGIWEGEWQDLSREFQSSCGGGFMVGIHARTGAWFNMIGALCAKYDSASGTLVPMAPALAHGYGSGGGVQQKQCPANQAIEYISFSEFEQRALEVGIKHDGVTLLDEIIFKCRPIGSRTAAPSDALVAMVSDDQLQVGGADTTKPYITGPDVNSGFVHKQPCGAGEFARGLAIRTWDQAEVSSGYSGKFEGVHGIGLICADAPQNPGGSLGGSPPPPPPPPPPQPIDLAGGGSYPLGPQGGGKQIDLYCPTGQAMVGLYGSGKANNMDRVELLCARFAGRMWSGLPIESGTLGTGAFSSATMRKCTPPGAVTAVDGDVSSYGGIARLRLRCGSDATAYMGRGAPATMETWTHSVITCGPNNVARGLYGWLDASGAVKSFGLHCLPASAYGSASSGGGASGGGSGGGGSGGGGASGVSLGDFAGTWRVTVDNGYSYTMQLFVSGGVIRGSYDAGRANGQVSGGTLSGSTLTMHLSQSAVVVGSGTGTFHFTDPVDVAGTWSIGPFSGTWTAHR
jgi:hypothetical protein